MKKPSFFSPNSRRDANPAPKTTSLRLEALEARALLDAASLLNEIAPPAELLNSHLLVDDAPSDAPIDLSSVETLAANSTTWVVTSTADDSSLPGTLRYAIRYAEDGDTITFDSSLQGATITFGRQLTISKALTIDASALWNATTQTPGITIDANQTSRVFYVFSSEVAFNGIAITNGKSTEGGGGLLVNSGAIATLTNCSISGNTSSAGGGGAYVLGTANFTNCSFSGNSASSGGGVYLNPSKGTCNLANCSIIDNFAGSGGGAYIGYGPSNLTNCSISGNVAASGGGAYVSDGTGNFTNCTIGGNAATYGGGVYRKNGGLTLYNSIVAANSSADGAEIYEVYKTTSAYNTLSSYTNWANASESDATNYVYDASLPLFIDPENGDFRLAENSQALDKGNNDYVTTEFDLAGNPRLFESVVDLGAFELNDSPRALLAPTITGASASANSITTSWRSVAGATGYELVCDGQTIANIAANATSYTIDGLASSTSHALQLKAFGDGTTTLDSNYAVATVWIVAATEDDGSVAGTLRYAIDHVANGDVVTFAPSLQGSTITLAGTQLEITKSITIDASALWDATTQTPGITIDANQASRVIYANAKTVAINGIAITKGVADFGSGLWVERGASSLTNCLFNGNSAARYGGGAYVTRATGYFTNCSFSDNTANSSSGGGVFLGNNGTGNFTNCSFSGNAANSRGGGAYIGEKGVGSFANCSFSNNSATGDGGGACVNDEGTTGIFTNCAINGNTASSGGGVSVAIATGNLTNCAIIGNVAAGGGGGAYVGSQGTGFFTNCSINGNSAGGDGGGAYVGSQGTGNLTNCAISGNAADSGKGGGAYVHSFGTGNMTGCVISENSAEKGGGASLNSSGTGNFINCVVSGNSASMYGGGANIDGTGTFTNCAIAGNSALFGALYSAFAASLTLYNSIVAMNCSTNGSTNLSDICGTAIAYNTLSSYTNWTNASESGAINYVYDASLPLFVDSENGNYRLAENSQAIDKGNNDFVATESDLAKKPRIFGNIVDLGAYEYGHAPSTLDAPNLTIEKTASTITLSWNAVENALGYEIDFNDATISLDSLQTSYTFTGLTSSTSYAFVARTIGDGADYVDSEDVDVTVETKAIQQLARPSLTATKTAKTITLNWDAIPHAKSYTITYRQMGSETALTATYGAGKTSCTLSGLESSKSYYVMIRANGDGLEYKNSAQSPTITVKTNALRQLTRPAVTPGAISANTIEVTWAAVENAKSYTLSYAPRSSNPVYQTATLGANKTSYTLRNLEPNRSYYVKICANGDGLEYSTSQQSPTVTIATRPYQQLDRPALTVVSPTTSTISVSWETIANATAYKISYAVKATEPVYKTLTYGASKTSCVIRDLAPDTSYYVKIQAIGDGFEYQNSPQSPTQTAKTLVASSGALLDEAFEELFDDAFDELEIEFV